MRLRTRIMVALGAALSLGAPAAHADHHQKSGMATPGQAAQEATSKEMTGRVVQASTSKLFLEHMGAVVEFDIASDAEFSGGSVRSAGELSEGQEVRASFTVENKTTNVAKRISLAREAGSAGPHHGGTGSAGEPETGTGTSAPPSERPAPQERVPGLPPGERPPQDPGTPAPRDPGLPPPLK